MRKKIIKSTILYIVSYRQTPLSLMNYHDDCTESDIMILYYTIILKNNKLGKTKDKSSYIV